MQDTDLECDPSFLNEAVVSVTGGIYSFRNNKGIEKSCNKRCAGLRVPGLEDAGEFSGAKEGFAAHNAYVGSRAKIGKEAYLENCYILGNSEVGDGTVLSHVRIMDRKIPEQIVMHGIELTGGKK